MDSLRSLVFVLSAFHIQLIASADKKFGCLFEDQLCSPYEICTNDGVFGRCSPVPVTDLYTYQVSPNVLQRLRTLLQRLAHRRLSWEDDATQQAVAQELSKLRKVSYRYPDTVSVDGSTKSRVANQNLKPTEVELGRSLQKYLQHAGLHYQLATPTGLRPKTGKPVSQDGPQNLADYFRPKSPAKGGPQSSLLSQAPPAAKPPPAHSRLPGGEDTELIAALQRFLAGRLGGRPAAGGPRGEAEAWAPGLAKSLDGHRGAAPPQASPQRPKTDKLLFKSGSRQTKEPLTKVDEEFIQKVVTQLGRHSVDVDALSGRQLEELADSIADTLQVVDSEAAGGARLRGAQREMKRDPVPTSSLPEDASLQEQQTEEVEKQNSGDKDPSLVSKLLEYLDQASYSDTPRRDASEEEGGGQGAAGSHGIGVESVKSRTTQTDIAVEKKEAAPPPARGAAQTADPAHLGGVPEPQKKDMRFEEELQLDVKSVSMAERRDDYGYIITDTDSLSTDQGLHLMELLARRAGLQMTDILELSVVGPVVTFKVRPNARNLSTADVADMAAKQEDNLGNESAVRILQAGVMDKSKLSELPTRSNEAESTKFLILTVISIVCIIAVLLASTGVYVLRHRSHHKLKEKLTSLGTDASSGASATYQELCRQRMAVKTERPEPAHGSRINSVSSQFSDGPIPSPSARSSTSSWCEEPVQSNMDISTGHMILSYMEDHLKNKNRLEKEWEALCAYQAEPNACTVGQRDSNSKKNRSGTVVAYDHSRITLKAENNQGGSDYINASPIMDHDPRNPAYISTQGPLPSTVADFWQMVWENGCVVIVTLTPLTENGVKQCYHYWPDEGSNLYHIYEVNLVSEHIWCEDFLVRSFYLKNMQTNETRTVTQFHFLTWLNQNVPESSRTLLDFRRKVNKCYRGRSCPIIVHCSDGAGRTGTYILIDMVLNKMAKGAKEIDIAATLEHLRDQRPGMVQTKEQFEFALTAVAEEVNAILKALPQ
uniref:Protein tyrosine phosphatase receptor type N2 n=1 Tax=Paramormyrops kingsleyae TaxID=1676925 RepID=A0A3B3SPB4_9TELE|nr:receptor-type tyrosine-protein phosphatase N2 [Paramormyrops kingsleyae]